MFFFVLQLPCFKFQVILSVDMYFGATVVLRRVELSWVYSEIQWQWILWIVFHGYITYVENEIQYTWTSEISWWRTIYMYPCSLLTGPGKSEHVRRWRGARWTLLLHHDRPGARSSQWHHDAGTLHDGSRYIAFTIIMWISKTRTFCHHYRNEAKQIFIVIIHCNYIF